jgi:DNA-directed RNA polymerase subunit RPC12/RpoP
MFLLKNNVKIIIGDNMNIIDHTCPGCDAPLNYNVEKEKWICEYCGNEYTLADLKDNIEEFDNLDTNKITEYECSNCGAKVVTGDTTASTTCMYCGSSIIIKKNLVNDYHPDYIVPFKHNEEQIIEMFFNSIDPKKMCPKAFKNPNNIVRMTKLYVPFWFVSCDVMASVKGIIYKKGKNRDVNIHYRRLGSLELVDAPIKAKSIIPEEVIRGIEPFDLSEAKDFAYPYLAGMWAEAYDVTKDDVEKSEIKSVMEKEVINKLLKTATLFPNEYPPMEKNVFKSNYKFKYVLLPVWFIVINYNGRDYYFCVNDQTGKKYGEVPIKKDELITNIIIRSIITAVIFFFLLMVNIYLAGIVMYALSYFFVFKYHEHIHEIYDNKKVKRNINTYIDEAKFTLMDSTDEESW